MGAFDELVKAGKVRNLGASNYVGERLFEAAEISRKHGFAEFAVLQNRYNLVDREPYESDSAPALAELGMSCVPFYGIALGFLTRVGKTLNARINIYVGVILPLLIYVCALGVYDAEHKAPGANILNFGDSIWWAFVTICTIGYGDYYPVTFEGRSIAVLLMVAGLAFISVITVSVATMFLNRLEYDLLQKKVAPKRKAD